MENRNDNVWRVGPSEANWRRSGARATVASRTLEQPLSGRDWDYFADEAAIGSSRARYPDDAPRDAGSETPLVLIVEDEATIAEALQLIIEELGCRVALAPNGAAALAIARRESPALVLTDLMMPVMDGRTLIATLHDEAARGLLADMPVVVMTALGHVRARDLDVEGVLRKPFELQEIDTLVERFLGERLRRREGARAG